MFAAGITLGIPSRIRGMPGQLPSVEGMYIRRESGDVDGIGCLASEFRVGVVCRLSTVMHYVRRFQSRVVWHGAGKLNRYTRMGWSLLSRFHPVIGCD